MFREKRPAALVQETAKKALKTTFNFGQNLRLILREPILRKPMNPAQRFAS